MGGSGYIEVFLDLHGVPDECPLEFTSVAQESPGLYL